MMNPAKEMSNTTSPWAGFSIKIGGPRVGKGRLSVDDLADIVRLTQQAIKRIGHVLAGSSTKGGRKPGEVEASCILQFVGWKTGSAVVELELAEQQLDLFQSFGVSVLKAWLRGLASINAPASADHDSLPQGFDQGVLQTCEALGRVFNRGIESLRYQPSPGLNVPATQFNRNTWQRVRVLRDRSTKTARVAKVGRLEILDGHADLRGQLWEADGTKWICEFNTEHKTLLPDLWLRTLRVVGEAVLEPNREPRIKVDTVLPIDTAAIASPGQRAEQSFWETPSLDALLELQHVHPAGNLDSYSASWPSQGEPDNLLEYVLTERANRRKNIREDAH